jgi:hypothetical protein
MLNLIAFELCYIIDCSFLLLWRGPQIWSASTSPEVTRRAQPES